MPYPQELPEQLNIDAGKARKVVDELVKGRKHNTLVQVRGWRGYCCTREAPALAALLPGLPFMDIHEPTHPCTQHTQAVAHPRGKKVADTAKHLSSLMPTADSNPKSIPP